MAYTYSVTGIIPTKGIETIEYQVDSLLTAITRFIKAYPNATQVAGLRL